VTKSPFVPRISPITNPSSSFGTQQALKRDFFYRFPKDKKKISRFSIVRFALVHHPLLHRDEKELTGVRLLPSFEFLLNNHLGFSQFKMSKSKERK
jgi:hypothetical protein